MSALRRVGDLVAAGVAPAARAQALTAVAERYPVAITPAMAALIDRSDPADPIARQFVPDPRELRIAPEERADPIADGAHSPVKGIVHRYPDRVLLMPVSVCPVYCRFCFRRETVGPEGPHLSPDEIAAALAYIRARPEVAEVILSGGDPLMLSPRRLRELIGALDAIAHVAAVRIHTRLPVADPQALTAERIAALAAAKPVFMVVHCNHPREVSPKVRLAVRRIAQAGIAVLAQSVLLRGVNDRAETLEQLFRALLAAGIKPYYLHHPDLAPGTAHFRLSIEEGRALMRALRGRVSGLALPTYVLDIPGGAGKVPIGPDHVVERSGDSWIIEHPAGRRHRYP